MHWHELLDDRPPPGGLGEKAMQRAIVEILTVTEEEGFELSPAEIAADALHHYRWLTGPGDEIGQQLAIDMASNVNRHTDFRRRGEDAA